MAATGCKTLRMPTVQRLLANKKNCESGQEGDEYLALLQVTPTWRRRRKGLQGFLKICCVRYLLRISFEWKAFVDMVHQKLTTCNPATASRAGINNAATRILPVHDAPGMPKSPIMPRQAGNSGIIR